MTEDTRGSKKMRTISNINGNIKQSVRVHSANNCRMCSINVLKRHDLLGDGVQLTFDLKE